MQNRQTCPATQQTNHTMSTFQKAPQSVIDMALDILTQFETHKPLLDARVKIDFVFAHGDRDDNGNIVSDAITKDGRRVYGQARKIGLKDRAKGMGDAEILIDADYWAEIDSLAQRALLDHELHHLAVKIDKRGLVRDDLGRPVIQLRKHDHQFGWFNVIAERHKDHSIEVQQAMAIYNSAGQLYWPQLVGR